MQLLLESSTCKNALMRKAASEYLCLVASLWMPDLVEKYLAPLKTTLKSGLSDADAAVRKCARYLLITLRHNPSWQANMDLFSSELDSGVQRQINAELQSPSADLLVLLKGSTESPPKPSLMSTTSRALPRPTSSFTLGSDIKNASPTSTADMSHVSVSLSGRETFRGAVLDEDDKKGAKWTASRVNIPYKAGSDLHEKEAATERRLPAPVRLMSAPSERGEHCSSAGGGTSRRLSSIGDLGSGITRQHASRVIVDAPSRSSVHTVDSVSAGYGSLSRTSSLEGAKRIVKVRREDAMTTRVLEETIVIPPPSRVPTMLSNTSSADHGKIGSWSVETFLQKANDPHWAER